MAKDELIKANILNGRILHLKMVREYLKCLFDSRVFSIEIKATFLNMGASVPFNDLKPNENMTTINKEDSTVILKALDQQIENLQIQLSEI